MRIEKIYRYPVKGLSAEALEAVALTPCEMLAHDRRFALAQGDAPFDVAAPRWLSKRNFGCLMANERLALLHSAFDPHDGSLAIRAPGAAPFLGDTRTAEGKAAIARYLTDFLGPEARGEPRFIEAPGHRFSDVAMKVVSIIGLGSLHALEAEAGMGPWAEFDWLGQEIQIGQVRLQVVKRIVRCAATEVNPETAKRDANPPRDLRRHFGHADLGVYAEVLEGGQVALGDALEPMMLDL